MTRRVLLFVALALMLAAALAACGRQRRANDSLVARPEVSSGVRGVSTVDGGCPLVRDRTPCPARPVAAKVTVTDVGSGRTVAHVTTSADGRFDIPLDAGNYELHPTNITDAPVPVAPSQAVTVLAGRYTEVTIDFDSGVR